MVKERFFGILTILSSRASQPIAQSKEWALRVYFLLELGER
jgi:hypothetical protein